MVIKFIKDTDKKCWYLKDKTWRGSIEDLKVSPGIEQLIEEECSLNSKEVSFKIDVHFIEGSKNILKISEDNDHAMYETMYGTAKLCETSLLLFPTGYPEIIHYKIITNE